MKEEPQVGHVTLKANTERKDGRNDTNCRHDVMSIHECVYWKDAEIWRMRKRNEQNKVMT